MAHIDDENGHQKFPVAVVWIVVAGIFLADSLIRVPAPGVNEPHYLCKARACADATWCTGDFFLQSANAHSVFYQLAGPLTHVCSFEMVAVLGRVLSCGLLAIGWTLLCRNLFKEPLAVVAAAALFASIAHTGNFSGEWVLGGFESKVPAYGFALMGVANWLRVYRDRDEVTDAVGWLAFGGVRQWTVTGIWIGFATALHPVVGAWFFIGIVLSEAAVCGAGWAWHQQPRRLLDLQKRTVIFVASATICALPGLVPAVKLVLFTNASPEDADKANVIQVFWRLAHHLDPTEFSAFGWQHTAVLVSVSIACGIGLIRSGRLTRTHRSLLVLLAASAVIAATGTVIGWHHQPPVEMPMWRVRTQLLKFYPFRFFDALLPMVTAMLAVAVVNDLIQHRQRMIRGLTAGVIAWMLGSSIFTMQFPPRGYSVDSFAGWREACEWLRQETPDDALVFGPRGGFGLKWYAQRAEYVCFKDCPQDTAGILEWDRRLRVLHDWSRDAWEDERYDDSDLAQLRELTGITHILTRQLQPFESSPVFENATWKIFEIPDPVQIVDPQG